MFQRVRHARRDLRGILTIRPLHYFFFLGTYEVCMYCLRC